MDAYLSTIMNSFYGAAGQRCLANSLVLPIGEARDAASGSPRRGAIRPR
jgi:acyl-CoA reductase-like NAD-dependent aldehyde dehydrogenase